MQEQSIIETLLLRLDSADDNLQVVTAQEVEDWPAGMLETLCHEGLLAPTTPSDVYTCTNCDDDHSEEVMVVESPPGSEPRLYIPCPSAGRVRVYPLELRQWRLMPEGLAKIVSRLLGLLEPYQEILPARVWRLGVANIGGVNREAVMARGLGWDDGKTIQERISRGEASTPSIFILPRETPCPVSASLALSRVLRLCDRGFFLDRATLDLITISWPNSAPIPEKPTMQGKVRHSEDFRTWGLSGIQYILTPRQAQVAQLLFEAREDGIFELSQEYILDRIGCESDRLTLRDVFRKSNAWNNLIVPGSRRGMYRLNI